MPLMWCSCIKVFLGKKELPRFVRKIILTFNFEGREKYISVHFDSLGEEF